MSFDNQGDKMIQDSVRKVSKLPEKVNNIPRAVNSELIHLTFEFLQHQFMRRGALDPLTKRTINGNADQQWWKMNQNQRLTEGEEENDYPGIWQLPAGGPLPQEPRYSEKLQVRKCVDPASDSV